MKRAGRFCCTCQTEGIVPPAPSGGWPWIGGGQQQKAAGDRHHCLGRGRAAESGLGSSVMALVSKCTQWASEGLTSEGDRQWWRYSATAALVRRGEAGLQRQEPVGGAGPEETLYRHRVEGESRLAYRYGEKRSGGAQWRRAGCGGRLQPCEERGPCLICPSASCASLPLKPSCGVAHSGAYLSHHVKEAGGGRAPVRSG